MRDTAREQGHFDALPGGAQRVGSSSSNPSQPEPPSPISPTSRLAFRPHSRSGAPSSNSGTKSWLNNLRRPKTSPAPRQTPPLVARSHLVNDIRRDSALQPGSPATTAPSTIADTPESVLSRAPSLPAIVIDDSETKDNIKSEGSGYQGSVTAQLPQITHDPSNPSFSGLSMPIPTGGFDDFTSPDHLQFSNRGSMLLDGKRAAMFAGGTTSPRSPSIISNSLRPENDSRVSLNTKQARTMSTDEVELSNRVRSMYEFGNERGVDWSDRTVLDNAVVEEDEGSETPTPTATPQPSSTTNRARPDLRTQSLTKRESTIPREAHELAGGIEDWQDVAGGEVDRYGFIMPKKIESRGSNNSGPSRGSQLMRVSTALVEVSESPRRKRTIRRSASKASKVDVKPTRRLSKGSLQPPGSIYSTRSTSSLSVHQSPLRYASNRLPHNKERRWVDEASDMLTLPPGLEEIAAIREGGKTALAMKKKEWQREEKWRRMGRTSSVTTKGAGMLFDFDPKDPKVISRTWKGIPDRWRASAWYSFLAASAKTHKESQKDGELLELFHELQEENSPDDVQIDCDVPRTINRHIMFRRRYRGGQRLLFRVLHALSLYFPDIGYVQGMAALAATLLCYFDEEHAFVMMVRLWQLRGLDRLYSSGFGGLMDALDDFEKHWLRGNDVAQKLEELGITSTAYGTRWYLTMFNYSIPFPAQLRVWDAFMLLGDISNSKDLKNEFGADLDILHATSAALVDATREILLDSDFENAMKVLTSWIPVKDEDLLMKVASAEYKQRKKRP